MKKAKNSLRVNPMKLFILLTLQWVAKIGKEGAHILGIGIERGKLIIYRTSP